MFACEHRGLWSLEEGIHALGLELWVVVSRLLWVPGTELRSSVRAGGILNRLACTAAPESLRRNSMAFYRVSHPDLCPLFPIKKPLLTLLQNSGIEMDLHLLIWGLVKIPETKCGFPKVARLNCARVQALCPPHLHALTGSRDIYLSINLRFNYTDNYSHDLDQKCRFSLPE